MADSSAVRLIAEAENPDRRKTVRQFVAMPLTDCEPIVSNINSHRGAACSSESHVARSSRARWSLSPKHAVAILYTKNL
jgi:hypothetical protein